MFLVGLATSVHCISMCGPMVVTYAVKGAETSGWNQRILANVAYQGAKLVSYSIVGVLLGAIGSALNLDSIRGWAMLGAGVMMVIIGLGMTGKFPWAARLTPQPPRMLVNAIAGLRRKANADRAAGESTLATPVSFGLMTGLMPCAPLMAAEIAAASSGSPLAGGFIMLAFGLGTLPLLFAFGSASSLIPRGWKERLTLVLAFVVLIMGLVFVNRSAMLMGFPVNSHTIQAAVLGRPNPHPRATPDYKTGTDGVVEVELTVTKSGFQPDNLQIPSDQPVRLLVSRVGNDVCSQQLFFPTLGIRQDLVPDSVTTIELPATAGGSYVMTCGMGMFAGQLLAGAIPAGFELPSWSWLGVGFMAVALAYWLAAGIKPRVPVVQQPAMAFAAAAPAASPAKRPRAATKATGPSKPVAATRTRSAQKSAADTPAEKPSPSPKTPSSKTASVPNTAKTRKTTTKTNSKPRSKGKGAGK